MKKLPNFVKWIIILAALAAMGWMMWAVNDRASRVEMPAPDNTFGIYRTADSSLSGGMGYVENSGRGTNPSSRLDTDCTPFGQGIVLYSAPCPVVATVFPPS